jgi:hypothetical protein
LFATADPSPGEIMLSWTATGDDGAVGTAARHDIRYSTIAANSPALSDALFNLAASVTDFVAIPPPSPAGTPESLDITGLLEGVTYYFAIKAADENPNWSPLSNGATAQAHVTTRDITLDVSGYNFGNVTLGLSTQTTAAVTVSYDGNVNSTFRIYAATITAGSPWTLGTTQGPDRAVLFAGFNSDLPLLSDFIGTNVVLNTSQICDANWFVLDTDCVGVTPATDLTLWFRLDMPTTSSVVAEQQIQVTVEAGSP